MTVVELIDSEIERIKDKYFKMGTTYKMSEPYSYGELLKADGALRELEELKRKINENT